MTPAGVHGAKPFAILAHAPGGDRAEAVDVLAGIDRVEDALLGIGAERLRQRRLDENAVVLRILVEAVDDGEHGRERGRPRQPLEVHAHAGVFGRLQLVADVDLGCRVVADEHDRERGRAA